MKQRTASRLAWSIWIVTVVLGGLALTLTVLNGTQAESGDPFFIVLLPLTVFGFATVGAMVASRRSSNPIGWLLLSFGFLIVLAGLSDEYVIRGVRVAPGSLPFIEAALWIQNGVFVPAFAILPLLFLIFPEGRLLSPRWRPVLWAMVAFPAIGFAGLVIRPGEAGGTVLLPNPTGVESLRGVAGVLMTIGGIGSVTTALVCVAGLIVRFRRARGDERQQIRWLVYVAATAAILLMATFSTEFMTREASRVGDVFFVSFFTVLVLGIPAASGIAILKYRLYDLDIVVKKTVVFGVLAAFITAAYLLVVIGIPTMFFGAGSLLRVENAVPLLAAVALALLFQPVRNAARRLANRLVYGKRATPYELLTEFSGRLGGAYSVDDVLPRIARALVEGTGATHSSVWLRVGEELRPAAAWPEAMADEHSVPATSVELDRLPGGQRAFPVEHQGELLGAVAVSMPPAEPLTPTTEKLLRDLAGQAALILRNVRLTEELRAKLEELRASRQRLVTAQDEERRRLERNIHDGAQQQLVALAVKLRLVETLATKDPGKASEMASQAKAELQEALDDLRDLARGIYPPLLADKGLAAALEAQARKAPVPVIVEPDGLVRYPQEAEAAAYFCVLEALQNTSKYAQATRATVRLAERDGELVFTVTDDGRGFDPVTTPRGSGLQNMEDRVEALGGTIEIVSAPGEGTTVTGRIPVSNREGSG
jgi:signal transduction histidine kinase